MQRGQGPGTTLSMADALPPDFEMVTREGQSWAQRRRPESSSEEGDGVPVLGTRGSSTQHGAHGVEKENQPQEESSPHPPPAEVSSGDGLFISRHRSQPGKDALVPIPLHHGPAAQ